MSTRTEQHNGRGTGRTRSWLIAASLMAVTTSGCAARATADECNKACTNLKSVFLNTVKQETNRDETLKKLGATGAQLAEETASLFIDYFTRTCMKECESRATSETADCLARAGNEDDVKKCYQ